MSRIRKILVGDFTIKRMVCSIVFIYVCLVIFAYFFADRMIFLVQESSYQDGPEILKIRARDGTKLSALYLSNPDSKFTILYTHGNAEDIGQLREIFDLFEYSGFSVLAWDYRGYGTSRGKASEKNAYRDIEDVYEYLVRELETPPERVIALGRSVGGAVAMHLACREELAGLVLESSFVSAFKAITRIPLLPFDKFDNISKIKKVNCPVLVIHGMRDRIVPFSHGQKLFAAANEPKQNFWAEDAGHNDLVIKANREYFDAIKKFSDILGPQPSRE